MFVRLMAEPDAKQILYYRGRRLDVTGWIERHPGGAVLRNFLGQDATVVMHMCHDMQHKGVEKMLKKMDAGPAPDHPLSSFDSDYLELEQQLLSRGWFKPSTA